MDYAAMKYPSKIDVRPPLHRSAVNSNVVSYNEIFHNEEGDLCM